DVVYQDDEAMDGKAVHKRVDISYEGPNGKGSFRLFLYIPKNVEGPAPTFLLINNRDKEKMDPEIETNSDFWPARYIVDQGYATAEFQVSEIAPDDAKNPYEGSVHQIFDEGEHPASDAWKTIAAWAWGASRAMDYFETDPAINAEQVGVV